MDSETLLLINNGGYIFSGATTLIMGLLVYLKGRARSATRVYFLTNILFTIYAISFIFGTNATDPAVSRFFLMFSLVNLFTVTTNAHAVWAFIGEGEKNKNIVRVLYGLAVILFLFFISDPDRFLLPSQKYWYLPNYFTAGSHYWIFVLFFGLTASLFIGSLFISWVRARGNEKTRILYLLVSFSLGYCIGSLAFLPIFGIDINPIYSAFVGIHTIVIAYAILTYKLLDLHLVASRAIKFSLFTVLSGLLIVIANSIGNYAVINIPGFPSWLVPLASGLMVVVIGFFVMRRLREADSLKYEFINNISHKFRTPLTHIRWLSEELRDEKDQVLRNKYVEQLQYSSMRLFELTNIVIDVAEDSENENIYQNTKFSLRKLADNLIVLHNDQILKKNQVVKLVAGDDLPEINGDKTRLNFAMQILFENALIYTPENGQINVKVDFNKETREFLFSVSDNGIGIDSVDIPRLFSKFYRTVSARHTDTEGMGIGLYMAKKIIMKHNGQIWVESDGEGGGSTFSFAIPLKS